MINPLNNSMCLHFISETIEEWMGYPLISNKEIVKIQPQIALMSKAILLSTFIDNVLHAIGYGPDCNSKHYLANWNL